MAATLHSLPTLVLLVLLTAWLAGSSSLVGNGKYGDREALLAFKEALSDDSGSLRSWNGSSSDFCRWLGVTCSSRHPGRVVSLRLSYCNLGGSISPVIIGNLTFLRTLDLFGNMLSGGIPHTISGLRRLRSLQLSNNSLAGEIPAELANCSNLVFLSLGMNQIRGGIPSGLGSISQLQVVYVGQNNLVGRIPPSLGNLSVLERISLFQNTLEGPIPEGLSRLRYLQFVQAGKNNLTGTIPPLFFNISSLQYFGFSSNNLHGRLPPDAGRHLPNLEVLLLGGTRNKNNFSGTLPPSLSNATKLQILGLANNNFEGRVPPEIGKLCPVRVEMGNNMLKAEDDADWEFLRYFTNCGRLTVLDISNNTMGGVLPSFVLPPSQIISHSKNFGESNFLNFDQNSREKHKDL